MEEPIDVRYTFVLLLAISDPSGHVIGTDVAIARRINMPTAQFQKCIKVLMSPDENSNSKEEDGRRLLPSEGERGYKIVNYLSYRSLRDEEERREYMRNYMQNYRQKEEDVNPVNSVNNGKRPLAYAEGEEKSDAKVEEETHPGRAGAGITDGKNSARVPTTPQSMRVAAVMHRKLTTPWSKKEVAAYRALGTIPEEDLAAIETYYSKNWPPCRDANVLRHDMLTLLNNWPGEVDRAKNSATKNTNVKTNQKASAHDRTAADRERDREGFTSAKIRTPVL